MSLMMTDLAKLESLGIRNQGNWLDFHLELIELRIAQGLTQKEVADRLGMSQPAVSQFENLSATPNLGSVLAYALAIGAELNFSARAAQDQS